MRLLKDRVLLKALPKPTQTASGIHLISSYNDDHMQFEVLAVGPDPAIEVAPGDHVLVPQYHGNLHDWEDGRILVRAKDIVAKW